MNTFGLTYTVHSVQSSVYSQECTNCSAFNVKSKVYNVQSKVYDVQFEMCNVKS